MPYKDKAYKRAWNLANRDKIAKHRETFANKPEQIEKAIVNKEIVRAKRVITDAKRKYDREKLIAFKATLRPYYFEYMGGKCMSCGLVDHHIVFDYHHVDPSVKIDEVGTLINKAQPHNTERIKAIEKELATCVLVCVGCHRKIHAGLIECPELKIR